MRFLMIDRVRELVPDQRIVAIKNVAMESDYLEHHFPGFPIFPGVLALEAMAQASGHLLSRSIEILEQRNSFAMMTANSAKYMKFVRPGDQLVICFFTYKISGQHFTRIWSHPRSSLKFHRNIFSPAFYALVYPCMLRAEKHGYFYFFFAAQARIRKFSLFQVAFKTK